MKPIEHSLQENTNKMIRDNDEIILLDMLQIALRRWWVLVVGMCMGGIAGMALHLLISPVYQTQAVISASVDYARTGKLKDVEEDYMIKKVGDLIKSDTVIEKTLGMAAQQGIELDRTTFDEMSSLQRSFNDWLLVVRSEDPQLSADVANLWVNAAWSVLDEASIHLLNYDAYKKALDAKVACQALQLTTNYGSVCYFSSTSDLETQIDEITGLMEEERTAALGLVSATIFNLTEHAVVPSTPKILGQNTLALSGTLLGLILSCFVIFIWKVKPEEYKK